MSLTLLPPVAVNACEADAVTGARCTDGATGVALHRVDPQTGTVPPGVGLPASASCGETVASKRNKANRKRSVIFIVASSFIIFLTGKRNSQIA